MAKLSPLFNEAQFIDGVPAVGAKVFTYAAGSSTKLATYTTEDGDVAQANPIILNARGEPDSPIWLTEGQTYKFVFTSSTDTDPPTSPIRTIDDVTGVGDNSVTIDQWVESGVTPTFVSATQFTVPGDQTSNFTVNRRIKATVTAGTVYGYISVSAFGALTTVTVVLDSGSLDSGLSAVQLGLITPTNTSLPQISDWVKEAMYQADSVSARALADSSQGFALLNGVLTASVAANALTFAIKTKAGSDPSATDPVLAVFRNSTLATGDYVVRSITAATSLVISSGSTLGTTSAVQSQINVLVIDNAGTVELACVNDAGYLDLNEYGVISTTAEGGAGAADSINTIYSTTARTNVPYRNVGFMVSTQATAGTWASAPTQISQVRGVRPRSSVINYTAQASSGTAIDFTNIPSWVNNIAVTFAGFSTNGTNIPQVVLGDAGGFEVTGYLGSVVEPGVATANFTTGFSFSNNTAAASVWHGVMYLTRQGGTNTWCAVSNMGKSDTGAIRNMAGSKTLSDTLTQVRITAGGDTLDAGVIGLTAW